MRIVLVELDAPLQPAPQPRQLEPAREIFVYPSEGGGWSLLEISRNGSGNRQLENAPRTTCVAAAMRWLRDEPDSVVHIANSYEAALGGAQ